MTSKFPSNGRLMNRSILVTGSNGFIGRELVTNFKARGYQVFAMTRADGDTCQSKTWKKYPKADCVVHLAGLTFVPDSWKQPEIFIESNSSSTTYSLEYCQENSAKLIFLSTYMYSTKTGRSVSENDELSPANPYALSKYLGENLCKYYSGFFGTRVAILRPFNVYGFGQAEKFLIPTIIRQARVGDDITVMDSKPSRDYIYIDDLLEAIHRVVNSILDFDVFNLGTGNSYSVEEVVNVLATVAGRKLRIISADHERQSEINFTQADITHAIDVLGWKPKFSLFDGLTAIWNRSILR